jgi:REP-associated tyrosine transposase
MARPPRLVVPGQPLHLIQRGNNRSPMFFADHDYTLFRDTLLQASRRFGCSIHAYVLMANHVHLLTTPIAEQAPARMMQAVGRRYVRYVNERYQRTGTLWEGRYRSSLVDSEHYLLVCSRYIELNPVRAGMVDRPHQYRWSSYRCNALGEADALITPHALYLALGSSPSEQQVAYRALFEAHLESSTLEVIREATNKGAVLGNDRFREQIEATLQRQLSRHPHGGDRRSETFRGRRQP